MSSLAGRDAGLGAQAYVGQVVRAPKTAELIATLYRRQIVRGELRPGDTLPSEQQLMGQFGVSRPTLREAFRILEAEDLISVKRGSRGGARVTQPSLSVAARYVGLLLQVQGTTIADVYEARMVLEPACGCSSWRASGPGRSAPCCSPTRARPCSVLTGPVLPPPIPSASS